MQPSAADVDHALSSLGRFGKWQMLVYSMVCSSVTVSGCWHMMSIVFVGGDQEHHCHVPDNVPISSVVPNETHKGKVVYSQCSRYVNLSLSNETMPCTQWDYSTAEFKTSIVSEWDLVCEHNYMVEASQSIFNFGVMLGAIIFTTMADQIGRKPVHLGCQWAMIVIGVAIAFVTNYTSFAVLRLLLGAVREGAGLSGIVMACELFPASERTFAGTALELFWATAWMVFALIAYLIRDWRTLQLAISLPFVITIAEIWLLPESIPWLAANDYEDQAESILQRAAKFNGVQGKGKPILRCRQDGDEPDLLTPLNRQQARKDSGSEDAADNNGLAVESDTPAGKGTNKRQATSGSADSGRGCCRDNQVAKYFRELGRRFSRHQKGATAGDASHKQRYTFMSIVRSKQMLMNTFVMCSLWFASGVVYYGLSLSTSSLAGDKYVNFFISGAVEAPAYALTVFVLNKYGRRWPLCIFHLIAGVSLFISIFVPETVSGSDMSIVIVSLNMLGKFAMTAAFGTVVLYAPEIYPTNLRNFGFGLASCWGRIGGMIAPITAYINKTHPWISLTIFTVTAVVTGLMALLLPETLNRPLPETIDEIEAWTRSAPKPGEVVAMTRTQQDVATVLRNDNYQDHDTVDT